MIHAEVEGVGFDALLNIDPGCLEPIVAAAQGLQAKGVRFIATSCGLYAPFQKEIADRLSVPFLSSPLQLVVFLRSFLPSDRKLGLITGHSGLLTDDHLRASGFSLDQVAVQGMQDYPEFRRVVLEGSLEVNVQPFREDVIRAAESLKKRDQSLALVVLECSNLIPFRQEIQQILQLPVYDMVSLVNFFAAGYEQLGFSARYL